MSVNVLSYKRTPFPYATNAAYSWVSNTTLSVAAGEYRDSTNSVDISLDSAVTVDIAVNGVNGLDTGSVAASTWYYLHLIADVTGNNATAAILSTSKTAPYLPYGYGAFAFIGMVLTDGSSHFLDFKVVGDGNERTYYWKDSISVLSGGSSATFAAVDLSDGVPPIDRLPVILEASFTPAVAADACNIRPYNWGTTGLPITGVVAAKAQELQAEVLSLYDSVNGVNKIDYKVAASGALSLSVAAFKYFV